MGKMGKRTHTTRYYQGFKHFPLNYARGKVGKVTLKILIFTTFWQARRATANR